MNRRQCGCIMGDRCTKMPVCEAEGWAEEVKEEFEADALRYRWLRNSRLSDFPATDFGHGWWEDLGCMVAEDFDDVIDKAMVKP